MGYLTLALSCTTLSRVTFKPCMTYITTSVFKLLSDSEWCMKARRIIECGRLESKNPNGGMMDGRFWRPRNCRKKRPILNPTEMQGLPSSRWYRRPQNTQIDSTLIGARQCYSGFRSLNWLCEAPQSETFVQHGDGCCLQHAMPSYSLLKSSNVRLQASLVR